MWVPLVEYGEAETEGADFFVKKHIDNLLKADPKIDTILLGCTHYPLLIDKIRKFTPPEIEIISQGEIVARALKDYLSRHPEIESLCSKGGSLEFLTTEHDGKFSESAAIFMGRPIEAAHIEL